MFALFICLVCSGFAFSCLLVVCYVVLLIVARIVVLLLYCLVLSAGL